MPLWQWHGLQIRMRHEKKVDEAYLVNRDEKHTSIKKKAFMFLLLLSFLLPRPALSKTLLTPFETYSHPTHWILYPWSRGNERAGFLTYSRLLNSYKRETRYSKVVIPMLYHWTISPARGLLQVKRRVCQIHLSHAAGNRPVSVGNALILWVLRVLLHSKRYFFCIFTL